jgi:hypothetical protein
MGRVKGWGRLSGRRVTRAVAAFVSVGLLFALAASAQASVGTEVSAFPTSDQLNRTENPLSNAGKWARAFGVTAAGQDTVGGWSPGSDFSAVGGAYWNTNLSGKAGTAAAIDLAALPGRAGNYGSLWIDMPAPATAKTGYELSWTADPTGGTYTVKLSRWSAGIATLLGSKAGVALTAGTRMALADTGPTVAVWTGTGASAVELLAVEDAALAGGYAGIGALGSPTRLTNFREGAVPLQPTVAGAEAAVTAAGATLSGTVDPNGAATSYQFEYGPTTAYGASVPVPAAAIGAGTANIAVSQAIGGLEAGVTYHYRLVATNSSGTVRDIDRMFELPAPSVTPFATQGSGSDFAGMMWTGNEKFPAPKEVADSVQGTGAKWYRLEMYQKPEFESLAYENTIDQLARKGITVLPYFGTGGQPDITSWGPFIQKEIRKYGPSGTFWKGKNYAKPMTYWEIGNEPNRGDTVPGGVPLPATFGKFFAEAAAAARGANPSVKIMFASLYSSAETTSTANGKCQEVVCKMKIGEFLRRATTAINAWDAEHPTGPRGTFDAVGVHPYVFKVGGKPISQSTIPTVMKEMNGYVEEAHSASLGNPVWVTEFGWPTEYKTENPANKEAVPPVSPQLQGELITKAFQEFRSHESSFNIARVFYYNLADEDTNTWTGGCGLRKRATGGGSGGAVKRPAWTAFAEAANGDYKWPKALSYGVIGEAKALGGKKVKFKTSLNDQGDGTMLHFQFWKPGEGANPVLTNTPAFRVEGDEIEQTLEQAASGLQPSTPYMFHAVATTEEELTTLSENHSFTTPPSTSTSVKVHRILHGTPGYVWIEGYVKEGSIEGSLPGVAGAQVHVKLFLNGVYQRFIEATTDATGHYETGYKSIAKGSWTAYGEFPGGGELDRSESGPEPFSVRDGVEIVDSYVGGCLDVENWSTADGGRIQHAPCLEPATHQNQVFELVPVEAGRYLNIVARNSGKCFDVVNGSYADGAEIQQYSCLGPGATNQAFEEYWWPGTNYISYIARHSGKCLDVPSANPGFQLIQQYTCNGYPQQKFELRPVETS